MKTNIMNFNKLSELISLSSRKKQIIVLNPDGVYYTRIINDEKELDPANIICDKSSWEIDDAVQQFVKNIAQNNQLSAEQKILLIYEELCKRYIYDDNVLTYIKKTDQDKYALPDWYGRDVDEEWKNNRKNHERRVCYEVSRYLAKALMELFKYNESYNICIIWDKGLAHYYVGLTCPDYSLTLDLDNFDKIKDLTRVKTGLSVEGITILEDTNGKFTQALNEFNTGRVEKASTQSKDEVEKKKKLQMPKEPEEDQTLKEEVEPEEIIFLRYTMEILKEKYNIDSQGLYEYMKEIVDVKFSEDIREKVWKKLDDNSTRYTRCLIVNIRDSKYLIDVADMVLRKFDKKEFEGSNPQFIPFKALNKDWEKDYYGL